MVARKYWKSAAVHRVPAWQQLVHRVRLLALQRQQAPLAAHLSPAIANSPAVNTTDESEIVYDIDDQSYEEADDDFIPSEEIPADEPIPFPTSI